MAITFCDHTVMDMEARQVLADNLRRLMAQAGLSQVAMAKRSGVSQRTISYMLRPQDGIIPGLDRVEAVAFGLGVPTWAMLVPCSHCGSRDYQRLGRVVENYVSSTDDGRDTIDALAKAEARFAASSTGKGLSPAST